MPDIWQFADELGPAKIIQVHEPSVGLKAMLVVDNAAAGPRPLARADGLRSHPVSGKFSIENATQEMIEVKPGSMGKSFATSGTYRNIH